MENISYGGLYDKEQVIEAAKLANAHEFITEYLRFYLKVSRRL